MAIASLSSPACSTDRLCSLPGVTLSQRAAEPGTAPPAAKAALAMLSCAAQHGAWELIFLYNNPRS